MASVSEIPCKWAPLYTRELTTRRLVANTAQALGLPTSATGDYVMTVDSRGAIARFDGVSWPSGFDMREKTLGLSPSAHPWSGAPATLDVECHRLGNMVLVSMRFSGGGAVLGTPSAIEYPVAVPAECRPPGSRLNVAPLPMTNNGVQEIGVFYIENSGKIRITRANQTAWGTSLTFPTSTITIGYDVTV